MAKKTTPATGATEHVGEAAARRLRTAWRAVREVTRAGSGPDAPPFSSYDPALEITLPAARLRRALTILILALTALSFIGALDALFPRLLALGPRRTIDVNFEASIPTWYSAIALAVSAALSGCVAATLRARKETRDRLAWAALAFIFALFSLDEVAGFHEIVNDGLNRLHRFSGYFRFAWVLPALALVIIVGSTFIPFLFRLERRRRLQFIAAGLVYAGGVVGMEMIGGKVYSAANDQFTLGYAVCVHVEEFLEMFGIALFNFALIEHLAGLLGPEGLRLRFTA